MEEGKGRISKEDLKRKLDREDGDPKPDEVQLLKADLDAVEQLEKAEKAAEQKASADEEKEIANQIIGSYKDSSRVPREKETSDK